MMKVKLLFVLISVNFVGSSLGSFPLPYITPELCKFDEYFDPVCLKCKRCGASRKDGQENRQQTSEDGLTCVCGQQYYLKERKGPYNIICEPCPEYTVPAKDGLACVSCPQTHPFNETTKMCEPCYNGIIAEDGVKQLCLPCANKAASEQSSVSCRHCSGDYERVGEECSCRGNLTLSGGHCLPLVHNKPSLFTVKFENGISVRSAFFVEHFNAAYHNCKEHNNSTACQVLANMCVMILYRVGTGRIRADDDACSEFVALMKERTNECQVSGKSFGLWLYYSDEDTQNEIHRDNVPSKYSSDPSLEASKLKFVAVKYDLNGRMVEMLNLRSRDLHLCQGLSTGEDFAFIFGTSIEQKCQIRIQELWNSSSLFFYEVYLISDVANSSQLYPVPVLIKNIRVNGELVNKDEDVSKWQLVRRFFLTDGLSGIETGSELQQGHQPAAKVFRYAADVTLQIVMKIEGTPGSIYPPLLIISYEEATQDDYFRNGNAVIKFSVLYQMDQSEAERGISITMGVLSVLAFVWSLLQTWSWFRRDGKQAVDVLTLGKFFVFMCGNLATTFFIIIFCASLNWFFMFKMQDVVHTLLPTGDQEKFLSTYLGAAFAMKSIEVIHMLVTQCRIDIFFIDWERPRSRTPAILNHPDSSSPAKSVEDNSPVRSSNKSTALLKNTPDKPSSEMAGISIWRTYFVANEWAEIQVMRKISLSLQLFLTLFFLKVVGFEDAAYAAPMHHTVPPEVKENVPYSATCHFALGSAVYLGLALIQVAFRKGIYERFIEDKLQQYIDLCSVSNVSIFILVTKRFGYYIHGRSAHGKADVNMKEMHELLRREEDDLCGTRGLLPNTEQQTFLMSLPIGLYEQFKRLLGPLTTYSQAADRMQGVGGRLSKVDIDKVVTTYHMLNKFLAGFIEHAFKDLDYIVKDKVMLENVLDIELYEIADRGYFYNDGGHSFDSVLLFGNESTLLIFDTLLFSIIAVTSSNYILAAILTYIIGKLIQILRQSAGRRNLVRKALVDERFLT